MGKMKNAGSLNIIPVFGISLQITKEKPYMDRYKISKKGREIYSFQMLAYQAGGQI